MLRACGQLILGSDNRGRLNGGRHARLYRLVLVLTREREKSLSSEGKAAHPIMGFHILMIDISSRYPASCGWLDS